MAEFVEGQWGDPRPGLPYGERRLSRHDVAAASAARAALLADLLPHGAEPHVGVLLGNVPEFPLWLGAAAYAGAAVVGVNPTWRSAEQARDLAHTERAVLVTERAHLPSLRGLALPLPPERSWSSTTRRTRRCCARTRTRARRAAGGYTPAHGCCSTSPLRLQVMAALAPARARRLRPRRLRRHLAAQTDLGTKSAPRFVRIVPRMPVTATGKVRRAALRRAGFRCPGPVWWSPPGEGPCGTAYRRFSANDLAALPERYRARDRSGLLGR